MPCIVVTAVVSQLLMFGLLNAVQPSKKPPSPTIPTGLSLGTSVRFADKATRIVDVIGAVPHASTVSRAGPYKRLLLPPVFTAYLLRRVPMAGAV